MKGHTAKEGGIGGTFVSLPRPFSVDRVEKSHKPRQDPLGPPFAHWPYQSGAEWRRFSRPARHSGYTRDNGHCSVSRTNALRRPDTMSLMTASESLLQRIRSDFNENPGLRLTPWQFRQMWSLAPNESRIVMQKLVTAGFLREDPDGALVQNVTVGSKHV